MFHIQNRNNTLIIPPPELWYKATNIELDVDDEVIRLYDMSGNGHDSLRVDPSVGNIYLSTSGYNHIISNSANYGGYFTIIDPFSLNGAFTIFVVSHRSISGSYHSLLAGYTGDTFNGRLFEDSPVPWRMGISDLSGIRSMGAFPYGNTFVAYTPSSMWTHGIKSYTYYDSATINNFGEAARFMAGNLSVYTDRYIGSIYEFIIYDTILSDYEIGIVFNYLMTKYSLD